MPRTVRTRKREWDEDGQRTGNSVPEPWYSLARDLGMVDPHSDEPSINGISRGTGISLMTTSRIIKREYGTRGPSPAMMKQFADAFGVDVKVVADYLNVRIATDTPWERPDMADYLTEQDGQLVTKLIMRLTRDARQAGSASTDVDEDDVVKPARKPRATKVARRPAKATGGQRKRG